MKLSRLNEAIFNETIYKIASTLRHKQTNFATDRNAKLWTVRNYLVRDHNI